MPVKSSKVKVQKSKITKATKTVAASGAAESKPKTAGSVSLTVPVYSLTGKESGTLALPKEIFAVGVNKKLLAQAMRVYTTNQKVLSGSTKTRGEVAGSTAKIYRQKGTGRARHGSVRAPIFVGGGIVFGPRPRKVRLDLPQQMKKAALLSALSSKISDKRVLGLSGLEKASGKTKEMAELMDKLLAVGYSQLAAKSQKPKAKSVLIVTGEKQDNAARAVRNIAGVSILSANLLNAYEVLRHGLLLITKEAVEKIGKQESRVKSPESSEKTAAKEKRGEKS